MVPVIFVFKSNLFFFFFPPQDSMPKENQDKIKLFNFCEP